MAEGNEKKACDHEGVPDYAAALCRWIQAKHLESPAAFFLEIHRPLMPLAWPAAVLCGTFLAPFLGGPDYYDRIEALRDPAVLDRVLARLAKSPESTGNAAAGGGDIQ